MSAHAFDDDATVDVLHSLAGSSYVGLVGHPGRGFTHWDAI